MDVTLALVVGLLLVAAALIYRVRAAWSPFGHRGRRRLVYWARGWWSGENAANRGERS